MTAWPSTTIAVTKHGCSYPSVTTAAFLGVPRVPPPSLSSMTQDSYMFPLLDWPIHQGDPFFIAHVFCIVYVSSTAQKSYYPPGNHHASHS